MSKRARAFIITKYDRFNTDKVVSYGDRRYIFRSQQSPFNVDEVVLGVWKNLEAAKYNPELDFIVMTGPMIMVSLFLAAVALRYPKFKVLMFDAPQSNYRERVIDADQLQEMA